MASGRPAIVERLRQATSALHAEIDGVAGVAEGGRDRYVWFVAKQYGFLAPLEARLGEVPALADLGLDLEQRRKAHLFAADLLHFDLHPARLPRCASLPAVDSPARALGALYVVEGATLGGAFLLAQLGRALGISPGAGASGLAPYGGALYASWMAYAAAVDRFVRAAPQAEDAVVEAACDTFRRMIAWLRA
jgi:heme oxygenase